MTRGARSARRFAVYAWPFEQRHVWRTPAMPLAARVLERVTRAR